MQAWWPGPVMYGEINVKRQDVQDTITNSNKTKQRATRAARQVGTRSASGSPKSSVLNALIFLRAQSAQAATRQGVEQPDGQTSDNMHVNGPTELLKRSRRVRKTRKRNELNATNLPLHPTEPPGEPSRAQQKIRSKRSKRSVQVNITGLFKRGQLPTRGMQKASTTEVCNGEQLMPNVKTHTFFPKEREDTKPA
jgi:hypothetical protein